MNEFGEAEYGKSVRFGFDEGRGRRAGHWPSGLSIHPLPPTLQNRGRNTEPDLIRPSEHRSLNNADFDALRTPDIQPAEAGTPCLS